MTEGSDSRKPKYKRIQEDLREKIEQGTYRPGTRLPPDSELHKYYNVNRLTMIRALEELSREGLIIRQQGSGTYVTDFTKTPFIPGRKLKIGILFPSTLPEGSLKKDSEQNHILRGILDEWNITDFSPIYAEKAENHHSRAVLEKGREGLTIVCLGQPYSGYICHPTLEAVKEENFDGIITVCVFHNAWLSDLLDLGIPTVVIDHPVRTLAQRADTVFVDPQAGYAGAVEHFISKGNTRIHFVGQLMWAPAPDLNMTRREWQQYRIGRVFENPDSRIRLNTVRQVLLDRGLDMPDEYIHFSAFRDEEERELCKKLLSLSEDMRPEAIIGHSFSHVTRIVQNLRENGIRVDGTGAGEPQETVLSIHTRIRDLGNIGADLLYSRLKKPDRLFYNVGIQTWFGDSTGSKSEYVYAGSQIL